MKNPLAGKMRIKIVKDPVVTGGSQHSTEYRKAMQAIAGKWVEVETDYLFQTQFNVTANGQGLRIHAEHVEKVVNDARKTVCKCSRCGCQVKKADKPEVCKCGEKGFYGFSKPRKDCSIALAVYNV